jgi:predicted nucleic acid-binding protein
MRLVFDTLALLNLIRFLGSKALSHLKGNYILTLTPYEVGNALWREATLLSRISIDEALSTLSLIASTYRVLNIITPSNIQLVLRVAHELKITYYDSSYILASHELNAGLVTDDERLRKRIKAKEDLLAKILGKKTILHSTKELVS